MRSTKFSHLPRALALALLLPVARPGLAVELPEAAEGARPGPTLATGHVFVILQTDPDESPAGFSFNHTFVSSPVPSPFTLTDGSLQIFNFVPDGPYTVTQLATSGWALVESAAGYETGCSDSNGAIDISSGVATINVVAGGFIACTFVMQEIGEVPPDPDSPSPWTPRGIGYWKNSGKCLKNQSQVATLDDDNQVRMLESHLLGGSAVYPLGSIAGMTCLEAARILDKSDLAGAKKANDGAYNLAAHLLAAKLNKAAGAFVPPCAANDMATAQSLLVQLGFTGMGDYLGPATSMRSLRTTALRLGGTLASFNGAALKDNCA